MRSRAEPRELDGVAAADDGVAGVEGDLHERPGRSRRAAPRPPRGSRCTSPCADGTPRVTPRSRARAARHARPARPRGGSRRRVSAVARVASGRPATREPDRRSRRRRARPAPRAGRGEDLDRPVEEREVVAKPVLVGDAERREGADELEPVRRERRATAPGRSPKYPGGPSSIPVYPRPRTVSQHPLGRDQVVAVDRPLPDAPGARRARKPRRHRNRRSSPRAVSYSRRAPFSDRRPRRHLGDGHVPPALVAGKTQLNE